MKQVLLFLWVVSAGILLYLVDAGASDNSKVFGGLPVYVVNNSDGITPLFSESDSRKQVSQISSGEHFLYLYSGDSGAFWYGIHEGKRVLIKDESRRKSLRLVTTNIFLPTLTEAGVIMLGLTALMLLVGWRGSEPKRTSREKKTDELSDFERNELKQLTSNNLKLGERNTRITNKMLKLQEENKQQKAKIKALELQGGGSDGALLKENKQKRLEIEQLKAEKRKNAAYINELKEKYDQTIRYLAEKFRDEREELNKQINRDTETHYNVKIEQIQAAYDQLKVRYQNLEQEYTLYLEDALKGDDELRKNEYESVLKGRQFELFIAREMTRTYGAAIQEWTSDKGIDEGIYVASNGNPDFVFRTALGHIISVECKFRSAAFNDKGIEKISWAQDWQAERYQRYARDKDVPVFLAIGFGEDSSKPNSVSLFELNELIELSDFVEVKDRGIQLMIPLESYRGRSLDSESLHNSIDAAFLNVGRDIGITKTRTPDINVS